MSNPITIDLATKAKILTYYHNFTFHRNSAFKKSKPTFIYNGWYLP